MRIWLVFVAVGMLFIVACGGSASSPSISSLTDGEAVAIVQTEMRLMCSPKAEYVINPQKYSALAQPDGSVTVGYNWWKQTDGRHTYDGMWVVHKGSHVVQTLKFKDSHC